MKDRLQRSITVPLRDDAEMTWAEIWEASDSGLIFCWEKGRRMRLVDPDLAARAEQGELVTLVWKGGTENLMEIADPDLVPQAEEGELTSLPLQNGMKSLKLDGTQDDRKTPKKPQPLVGSLKYMAMWQGLRNEDLDVALLSKTVITCTKTQRKVVFRLAKT
jgi:hypothetical protein